MPWRRARLARVHGVSLGRHILPATLGFLRVQALVLIPSAILAETTLSYAGLGFGADHPSWGTLLQEASDIRAMADYPWLLSAAGADHSGGAGGQSPAGASAPSHGAGGPLARRVRRVLDTRSCALRQ